MTYKTHLAALVEQETGVQFTPAMWGHIVHNGNILAATDDGMTIITDDKLGDNKIVADSHDTELELFVIVGPKNVVNILVSGFIVGSPGVGMGDDVDWWVLTGAWRGYEKTSYRGDMIHHPIVGEPARVVWKTDAHNCLYVHEHRWYQDGVVHRDDDLPAVVEYWSPTSRIQDGVREQYWYHEGVPHRVGAPAAICATVKFLSHSWFHQGELHRTDGPAAYDYLYHDPEQVIVRRFHINGEQMGASQQAIQACDPDTPAKKLARFTRYKNIVVATLAAHNPNCPEDARTMFALTRS